MDNETLLVDPEFLLQKHHLSPVRLHGLYHYITLSGGNAKNCLSGAAPR